MADITQSLFGITPESLMAQREAALQQQAAQYAQLTPMQAAQAGFYTAGNRLGGAVGGLLGAEDPQLALVRQRQQLLKGADIQTASGLKDLSQKLYQAGDYQGAQQALAQAQAREAAQIDLAKKAAETSKTMFDISSVGKALDLAKTGKFTSESIDKYIKGEGELVPIDKDVKPTSDFVAVANELGYGAKTTYGSYSPEQTAQVNAELQKRKIQTQIAGANRLSVVQQQESEFAKTRGGLQAKALNEAEGQAKTSASALERLATMESKNKGQMLTGPLAGTAIGAGQFLSSLGLLSPDSAKTLANSEVYDKSAKDLVMQDLGGKLGGQVSDADRNYIEARIPQLKNSQQARTELISRLKEIHKKNIGYYQNMSKYANEKGNLNGFDFAQNAPTTETKPAVIKLD